MKIRVLFCTLYTFAVLIALTSINAMAESSGVLLQAYIGDRELNVIASGDFDLPNTEIRVANKQASITGGGLLSEGKVCVRTTVLVDVSTSMPYDARGKVLEFVEAEIKDLESYEELRLVTFGDKINILQDFSSDRYDLSNAAKKIEFNGTQSALYDAVSKTIPQIDSLDGTPCFYRTVVITDGADYTAGGITKEELFMQLRGDTYPIDVIGVSSDKPQTPDKDLSALSRISNGSYIDLYPGADIAECVSLTSTGNLFWIRAEVPEALLDGSTRQVDISSGGNSISFDMKMSVVDVPSESSSPVSSSESSDSTSVSAPMESENESLSENLDNDKSEKRIDSTILIVIGIGAILLAAVLVVVLSSRRKKNNQVAPPPFVEPRANNESEASVTELLTNGVSNDNYNVRLSVCGNPSENWTLTITYEVVVGRADNCALKFGDSSVSREQFKFVAGETGIMLVNLSTSNVTKVNGTVVNADILIHPGDIIKFGRISLCVDLIQKVSASTQANDSFGGRTGGDTETVF